MTLGSRASSTPRRSTAIHRVLVVCSLLVTGPATAADSIVTSTTTLVKTERVQVLVDQFRARLKLPRAVTALSNEMPDGSTSVSCTPVAPPGPLFVTVIV